MAKKPKKSQALSAAKHPRSPSRADKGQKQLQRSLPRGRARRGQDGMAFTLAGTPGKQPGRMGGQC
jgi:hypothetical protein